MTMGDSRISQSTVDTLNDIAGDVLSNAIPPSFLSHKKMYHLQKVMVDSILELITGMINEITPRVLRSNKFNVNFQRSNIKRKTQLQLNCELDAQQKVADDHIEKSLKQGSEAYNNYKRCEA